MLERMCKKEILVHCWWECKLVPLLRRTEWRFLKNLKIELLCDPPIPLLAIYPEKMKTVMQKDACTPMFIAAIFHSFLWLSNIPLYLNTTFSFLVC